MHDVYSNSYCNIAATGARDSSVGLFYDRNVVDLYPCVIEIPWLYNARYNIYHASFWETHIDDAPLTQRVWACQERLLAPRVLHFGRHQLRWECREMAAAEQYPNGLPPALRVANALFKGFDPHTHGAELRRLTAEPNQSPEFHTCQLWNKVVTAYSRTLLTKPEDKLVALSGVAKYMRAVNGGDGYVAGMWRRHLESQLLWCMTRHGYGDDRPASKPVEYRAPSFSWMSVDGAVFPGNCTDFEVLARVRSVEIQCATGDDTGLVSGGHLVLEGTLKTIGLKRNVVTARVWEMWVNGESLFQRTGRKSFSRRESGR
jgi:hypothetical protein